MTRILFFALFFTLSLYAGSKEAVFQLAEYENIAIATDLEPDDVLALKIIFDEANRLYASKQHYPIQLILVGEGNSAIKKARMEALLDAFFQVPKSVQIEIKEGKSTLDNLFPYDGEELFEKEKLNEFPFPQKEEGTEALMRFVNNASHPLIIQLKPSQELVPLSFNKELSQKTDVIFYGSFNFRKILRGEVSHYFHFTSEQKDPARLQRVLDHFGSSFKKIGIVETYGVLGSEGSVYHKHSWSQPIADQIDESSHPFYTMLKKLIQNWNRCKFENKMQSIKKSIEELISLFPEKQEALSCLELAIENNQEWVNDLHALSLELNPCPKKLLEKLERDMHFATKVNPQSGIQLTLSDVIVALALIDPQFLATPVKVSINEKRFLETTPDPTSNIYYYDRMEHTRFVEIFLQKEFVLTPLWQ